MDNPNVVIGLKVVQAFMVFIIFICPAILFSVFWTKTRVRYSGIITKPAFLTLLLGGIGIVLALPFINWLSELNKQLSLPQTFNGIEVWMQKSEARMTMITEVYTRGNTIGVLLLNLFVIAFMAALSEELFFRGILQKVLIECTHSKHIAIWIGAILFSAFHLQFYGFLPRVLMGAFLGYLFLWSGSLWPSIFAHFVNNGMTVFLIWLSNRGVISADADKVGIESEQWVYALTSAVMVVLSLVAVYFIEKGRKNKIVEVEPASIESI